MTDSIKILYSTPPRPLSQLSELSIPSAEKGTITLPPVFYTYVIVQLSKLDELADCKPKERLKSIKYIGETSLAPSERLKAHRRKRFADNPDDYSMIIIGKYPNLGSALKGEFSLFKCKPQKYMDLVDGNEAGLGDTGSASLYNKEIRISITRQEIELTAVMLVNAFVRPVLVDTMTKPYNCSICRDHPGFYSSHGLKAHLAKHSGIGIKCIYCPYVTSCLYNHQEHMRTHSRYACNLCNLHFSLLTQLSEHKKIHEKPKYACPFEGCPSKGFTEQCKLNDHIQAIHEGKLFMCDHDNCKNHKGFTTRASLAVHRLTHSGRRVKCTNCDETFSTLTNMRKHCRKDHEDLIRGTFLNHMPLNSEP